MSYNSLMSNFIDKNLINDDISLVGGRGAGEERSSGVEVGLKRG